MKSWIKNNKIPSIAILVTVILMLSIGVWQGVTYLQYQYQKDFIEEIKPGALEAYENYNILPSLTMAQAIHESAWGRYHIDNNLFGIKASPKWDGKRATRETQEYIDGRFITVEADFRAYDSFQESVEDFGNFLYGNQRYSEVLKADNYKDAVQAVADAGYATDPDDGNKVINIIEKYELYEYDEKVKENKVVKIEVEKIEGFINDNKSEGFLIIDKGRVYVPIREVGETLGADVNWNNNERIWRVDE